ncbi:hypothetical protein FKM82_031232 [Ascaphus truei]
MLKGVVLNNLNLKQGHCVALKGFIPKDANGFVINIGQDSSNILLHFNARFDLHGDQRTIVCNSKEADTWGAELRETAFPFQQGEGATICFEYQADALNVKLPQGQIIAFPNRLPMDTVSFLSLEGIEFKSLSLG